MQDGLVPPSQGVNNYFHSRVASGEGRGVSPGRQSVEGGVTKTPLSKTLSASGVDTRKPLAPEARPHSADNRDTLKRDKLAEEVERIAVSLCGERLLGTCTVAVNNKFTFRINFVVPS